MSLMQSNFEHLRLKETKNHFLYSNFKINQTYFHKIYWKEPDLENVKHFEALAFIRRANLDAFWSRRSSTVAQNASRVRRIVTGLKDRFDITEGPFYYQGPSTDYDSEGYVVALAVLQASTNPGRYDKTHSQWQTVRHVKGAIANFERTFNGGLALVDDDKALSQHFQEGGSCSLWYSRFAQGCRARMGEVVKKDLALEARLIVALLDAIDEKVLTAFKAKNSTQRDRWIMVGAYLSISYVLSLRGNEGFMLDIKELLKNRSLKKGLVWIILSGILKGELIPTLHQLRSVPTTDSGVEINL